VDSTKLLQWIQQAPLELEKDRLAAALLATLLPLTAQTSGLVALSEETGYRLAACEPTFSAWHEVVVPEKMLGELVALESARWIPAPESGDPLAVAARSLSEYLRMQSSGSLRLQPAVVLPLRPAEGRGGLIILASTDGSPELGEDDLTVLRAIALHASRALQHADRFEQIGDTFHSFVETMADAIDAKDPHGQGHSRSVSYYSGAIARQLGLASREVQAIEVAGLLHDIGRLGIPDEILLKSGRLTDEEIASVRSYPASGAELLTKVRGMEDVCPLVRYHAERWDGKGYPDGLTGSAIPLGARTLAVAHSFVAMISHRSYRAPMTVVGGALKALDGMSGQALDPDVVRAFMTALGR